MQRDPNVFDLYETPSEVLLRRAVVFGGLAFGGLLLVVACGFAGGASAGMAATALVFGGLLVTLFVMSLGIVSVFDPRPVGALTVRGTVLRDEKTGRAIDFARRHELAVLASQRIVRTRVRGRHSEYERSLAYDWVAFVARQDGVEIVVVQDEVSASTQGYVGMQGQRVADRNFLGQAPTLAAQRPSGRRVGIMQFDLLEQALRSAVDAGTRQLAAAPIPRRPVAPTVPSTPPPSAGPALAVASSPPPAPAFALSADAASMQHRLLENDVPFAAVNEAVYAAGFRSALPIASTDPDAAIWQRKGTTAGQPEAQITYERHEGMKRLVVRWLAPSEVPSLRTIEPDAIALSPGMPEPVLLESLRRLEWLTTGPGGWAGLAGAIATRHARSGASPNGHGSYSTYDPSPVVTERVRVLASAPSPEVGGRATKLLQHWSAQAAMNRR